MRYPEMRGLLIVLLIILIVIIAVAFGAPSSSEPDPVVENPPSPLSPKHDTAIVAAPDGTIYLVEIGSGKVLWSFSSGPSIYSSYQQLPNNEGEKLNASADGDNFYIDCGEDWELYLHATGLKKVKLPLSAEEFVKRTPFVSGGGVMLGSKRTAVFLVDANTGKVVHTFRSDKSPSIMEEGSDETSIVSRTDMEEWLPTTPGDMEDIEKPLYITRTDYAIKYTSAKTGKVLWYLMFADIEASFKCEGIENFFDGFPQNSKFNIGHRLDMKLPMHCETRPVVYRVRDRSSLEPLFMSDGLRNALPGAEVLSLPAPEHHPMKPTGNLPVPLRSNEKEIMFALPTSGPEQSMIRSPPGGDASKANIPMESGGLSQFQLWPFLLYSFLVPVVMSLVFYVRHGFGRKQGKLEKQSEDFKLQNVTSKKKKVRKAVVSKQNITGAKRREDASQNVVRSSDEYKSTETTKIYFPSNLSHDNHSKGNSKDGYMVGKLIVSDKEIAKGSNGTVVLEGKYDGRSVAVKRLVRTHHDVAVKEIRNLIASDQHPNIVRWYGVEQDDHFVYLCLERCTCSLHDLVLFCSSQTKITNGARDYDITISYSNIQLLCNVGSNQELELWKANGYPSWLLTKLMGDIVRGLAHLHEIGIVHRDLKPQNVLVIKDRYFLSAKISDMGISKQLDGDTTSLTKHATGYGSSGWQAPEQLRRERQTRAVDLFSLGCILFFFITGGKHPFGDSLERDVNIVNNRKDLFLIDNMPEATDLISRLLDPNPDLRPRAVDVLSHPLFWDSETRLSFLRDASDRVELEDRENESELLRALESRGRAALGGKWDEKMDNAFINDIGRYRRYKFDSVRDLLRVIRNKFNHYRELSKEIQALLGPVPDGFDCYFTIRFPKLLIEVYQILVNYCAEEEAFQKYFRSTQFDPYLAM